MLEGGNGWRLFCLILLSKVVIQTKLELRTSFVSLVWSFWAHLIHNSGIYTCSCFDCKSHYFMSDLACIFFIVIYVYRRGKRSAWSRHDDWGVHGDLGSRTLSTSYLSVWAGFKGFTSSCFSGERQSSSSLELSLRSLLAPALCTAPGEAPLGRTLAL